MMETDILVKVTAEGQLKLPVELQAQLHAGDEYLVTITDEEIVLKKISKPSVDLDQFLEKMDALEPDPNQPSLEEIHEIVKEVRQELWSK
ncbi:MAG: AbrB/MazE/SpoVT family DNA-binding domain-containing protein [Desmonostoc geniculatum HA4340-LM1]|jgi:bifunctional DNA-binding transcriptional regulator/antitoxin component of YhaV-PrlF toxin-antitoxin module|nr:AbrB/MazE/SpoVT family DNA-binding domain-containing protein [Desmonostoc geniculatum HA4340-LM1]